MSEGVVQSWVASDGRAPLELSLRRGEPAWLGEWRRRAYEIYADAPMPIRASHLWRYTDPALFEPREDPFAEAEIPAPIGGGTGDTLWSSLERGELSGGALGLDLRGAEIRLAPELRRAGVTCLDLENAIREKPGEVQALLGSSVPPTFGKFEALNAATFRGGILLDVPAGVAVEKPIHLLRQFHRPGFAATRLLVRIGKGATVTLIDQLEGGTSQGLGQVYDVSELQIEEGATVHVASIQTLSPRTNLYLTQRAILRRGASFVPILASFGGALSKVDTGAVLEGAGSQSEMIGFLSAVGRQRFDHHTVHHHQGAHTHSNLDFRTVLTGRSHSAYTGLIRIEPEAAFSEAYQENRNLLLSAECRATSIPELEILTEEVQCKHGATVGPIDPGHLFYLMSRAIPREEAVRIIVEGHFEPTLKRLPAGLQERLRGILRDRLRQA